MSCDEFRGFLQDYVTRELEPETRRLVDAHLLECSECQRELALLTALVSSLDHQPVEEPSAEFTGSVLARLPKQRVFAPSPWWALVLAPVLAGAAWLARGPVVRWLEGLLGRVPHAPVQLPAITTSQVAVVAAGLVLVGLLLSAGAAYFCWENYLRD
jgi:anti-sigma factor RsiW